MSDINRKAALLRLIQTEHTHLETLLQTLSEEQFLQPGVTGSWSVKDVLAHLTWWEQAILSEFLHGVELDPGLGEEPWSTERANTLVVEAARATPLPEVLVAFHNSYQQIFELVEGFSEVDLANEETFTRLSENTGEHYLEHRRWIEAGLKQTGEG